MELKYLVVGTGRSGTVFMARLLTSIGIPCGHETLFDYRGLAAAEQRMAGIEPLKLSVASTTQFNVVDQHSTAVDWLDVSTIVADSSYMAAPFLDGLPDTAIIHAVRHPVRVIQSFCNHIGYFKSGVPSNPYESFIYEHVPELKEQMSQYDRAALYYVSWNRMVEPYRRILCKVEDPLDGLFEFLGVQPDEYFKDRTVNTYRKLDVARFSCEKVESSEIRSQLVRLGEEYGYHMNSDYLLV